MPGRQGHLEGILKYRFLGLPSKAPVVLCVARLGNHLNNSGLLLAGISGISTDAYRNSLMATSLSKVRFFHFMTFYFAVSSLLFLVLEAHL